MKNATDDELRKLGWSWVRRDNDGKVVGLTDKSEDAIEWLFMPGSVTCLRFENE